MECKNCKVKIEERKHHITVIGVFEHFPTEWLHYCSLGCLMTYLQNVVIKEEVKE